MRFKRRTTVLRDNVATQSFHHVFGEDIFRGMTHEHQSAGTLSHPLRGL